MAAHLPARTGIGRRDRSQRGTGGRGDLRIAVGEISIQICHRARLTPRGERIDHADQRRSCQAGQRRTQRLTRGRIRDRLKCHAGRMREVLIGQ